MGGGGGTGREKGSEGGKRFWAREGGGERERIRDQNQQFHKTKTATKNLTAAVLVTGAGGKTQLSHAIN